MLLAVIGFNFRRGGDIATPYVQSRAPRRQELDAVGDVSGGWSGVGVLLLRLAFQRHLPCRPAGKRAAEIRTLNQVAAVVADIGERAQKVQLAEAERLFDTDGWKAYDAHLAKLAQEAAGLAGRDREVLRPEDRGPRRGIIEQQERIAGAERGQTSLAEASRDELEAELQRLEPGVGALEAEMAKAQATYNETKQAIAAKRIDASAEDGGVEGTMKRGQGPVYRQRMAELDDLQRKLTITDEPRFKDAQKQRDRASARIVSLRREIATINGEVAKYKGEALDGDAAHQDSRERATRMPRAPRSIPPASCRRSSGRVPHSVSSPTLERLAAVQTQCGNLVNAMTSTPPPRTRCAVSTAIPSRRLRRPRASSRSMRALSPSGPIARAAPSCPRAPPPTACLASGANVCRSPASCRRIRTDIGARLQSIEMNRDDKAHRFVVTWNAFLDGNRLAYLALVLAIGVDALVLMAGLFGAAAVKSPLSDVPSPKARSAEQLEAIVKNALGEDRLENAELVLAAMRPSGIPGDSRSEVDLSRYDPETARRIRKVLVAGASIGAVERASTDPHHERYLVRSEMFEYLSVVANAARETDREYADRSRLIQIVGAALEPDGQRNAETVLEHVEPINPRQNFMAQVDLRAVPPESKRLVQTVLNAGMTLSAVQRRDSGGPRSAGAFAWATGRTSTPETTYLIRSDLFKTLLMYRAGSSALIAGREPPIPLTPAPERTRLTIGSTTARPRQIPHLQNAKDYHVAISERLREGIWNDLLAAIDLDIASAARLGEEAVQTAAAAAWQAIHRLAHDNSLLRRYLAEIEENKKDAIYRKYDELRSTLGGKPEALIMLDEAAANIDGLLRSFLLLPDAEVLPELIDRLEDAGQHNDGRASGEDALLRLLRDLEMEIRRIDTSDANAWVRIAQLINGQDRDGPATIREMNPVNKTPI